MHTWVLTHKHVFPNLSFIHFVKLQNRFSAYAQRWMLTNQNTCACLYMPACICDKTWKTHKDVYIFMRSDKKCTHAAPPVPSNIHTYIYPPYTYIHTYIYIYIYIHTHIWESGHLRVHTYTRTQTQTQTHPSGNCASLNSLMLANSLTMNGLKL